MSAIAAIATAAQLLTPAIPHLIRAAEDAWGPKTGDAKHNTVVDSAEVFMDKMMTAGKAQTKPSREEIGALVESIFQQQFRNPAPLAPAATLFIVNIAKGTVTPIPA